MNTTPIAARPTSARYEQMLRSYLQARRIYNTTRLGSPAACKAELRMERLVDEAERRGFLVQFCTELNSTRS